MIPGKDQRAGVRTSSKQLRLGEAANIHLDQVLIVWSCSESPGIGLDCMELLR